MPQKPRGRLYVDGDVQRALLWQLFRHWSIFVVVLVAMMLALEALGGPPRTLRGHLQSLWTQHATLLVVIAVLFPVFAYDSVKLSNRFVGPIMRLRAALQSAAAGQPAKPIQFRQGDFWQDMADHFNDLMEQVQRDRTRRDRVPTEEWDGAAPAAEDREAEDRAAENRETEQGALQEV